MTSTSNERLSNLGIKLPEILIPREDVSFEKWAVIACDQFSSEPSYWAETRRIVGNSPSSLNLFVPECNLEDDDLNEQIGKTRAVMSELIQNATLRKLAPGFILVNRSTLHVARRLGLILAVDLEAYDFSEDSRALIRPTEGTILKRLPPRMAIRRTALLDLPHIILLIDDPNDWVMGAARMAARAAGKKVYDFDLMQNGGHIDGFHIKEDEAEPLISAFERLADGSDLLLAVGDGNHSLASAREVWLEKKSTVPPDHPMRYAMVEVENIYDPGLVFHPIHRVMFNVQDSELKRHLRKRLGITIMPGTENKLSSDELKIQNSDGTQERWRIRTSGDGLVVESIQEALDSYLKLQPEASLDYIHGESSVRKLVSSGADRRLGIILPEIDKTMFFRRILDAGIFPRKTFSIGEATEKRYYLEARRL
ncbi:hypothetical protein S1OALGB6SA_1767 [Olavius algarvensis spirochete endosymbiont]|uniref:DUF1015 domain-containing protein n=1 Tax=Olavius algarvensis spirochete endosymbiont TaxID=260710 RepID=UPI000F2BF61A|nr:DUF1015 domain-containing protein [Olavius algarvensis spirochete endosymbiont]VDB00683.1 hypothetical protein S1OALGB6SA_1767 [Olavius algarvensis spirochete endosymbiont]